MTINSENTSTLPMAITSPALLNHWQGHRRLTRRVIEVFPENELFEFSIGGMRVFADMAKEIIRMEGSGIEGVVTDNWKAAGQLDYFGPGEEFTKSGILRAWDKVTEEINTFWPQILEEKFQETILAFGQYEGEAYGIIMYFIDNEIHHRAQGTVCLRSLGIEPPAFWSRD